jgi:hypothetical protein
MPLKYNTCEFVGTVQWKSGPHRGEGHIENKLSNSAGESAPSLSLSKRSNKVDRNC